MVLPATFRDPTFAIWGNGPTNSGVWVAGGGGTGQMGPTGAGAGTGGDSPAHDVPYAGGGAGGNMGPNLRKYAPYGWPSTGGGGGGASSHDASAGGSGAGGSGCVLIAYPN